MSLALIEESAKEVRRLAIAGSALAVGDFRLKKLIAPLEQASAKAPVFGQVAKAIGDLVNGKEAESAAHLLHLSTLLNAILYTQGQTATDGDYQELEVFATNSTSTKTPARVLKPLVEALTNAGGGRFEIVKAAFERGAFNDLRLIDPAIHALGDNYPELADLVAEKILPAYGPGIVPRLKEKFDPKGRTVDGRRLALMHCVDPTGTLDLCKAALEGGSPEVKVAAIGCLGQHEDCLPLVQEQVSTKNKALRAAALEALAAYDRPEISKLFTDLIKGKALDILAGPFRAIRNQQVLRSLLDEGRRVFDLMLKGDSEQIPRYAEILDCLAHRKETEVEEFLTGCLAKSDKLAKLKAARNSISAGVDMMFHIAAGLYNIGSPKSLEAVLARREALPPAAFPQVLRSALRTWPADKVFVEFSPLLDQKKGAGKEKSEVLQRLIATAPWDDSSHSGPMPHHAANSNEERALKNVTWDARWLDAGIKADQQTVVCCLARPGHKAALDYLLKMGDARNTSDSGLVIQALARCQYPKVTDHYLGLVTRKTKGAKWVDYELQFLFENARHLPAADLPKLDEFAATLDEKFMDKFLEALAPLREKAAAPNQPYAQQKL